MPPLPPECISRISPHCAPLTQPESMSELLGSIRYGEERICSEDPGPSHTNNMPVSHCTEQSRIVQRDPRPYL